MGQQIRMVGERVYLQSTDGEDKNKTYLFRGLEVKTSEHHDWNH